MTKLEKVESDVQSMNPKEFSEFKKWFWEFVAEKWDRQIEADQKSGKLDRFAQKAIDDFDAGKATKL